MCLKIEVFSRSKLQIEWTLRRGIYDYWRTRLITVQVVQSLWILQFLFLLAVLLWSEPKKPLCSLMLWSVWIELTFGQTEATEVASILNLEFGLVRVRLVMRQFCQFTPWIFLVFSQLLRLRMTNLDRSQKIYKLLKSLCFTQCRASFRYGPNSALYHTSYWSSKPKQFKETKVVKNCHCILKWGLY